MNLFRALREKLEAAQQTLESIGWLQTLLGLLLVNGITAMIVLLMIYGAIIEAQSGNTIVASITMTTGVDIFLTSHAGSAAPSDLLTTANITTLTASGVLSVAAPSAKQSYNVASSTRISINVASQVKNLGSTTTTTLAPATKTIFLTTTVVIIPTHLPPSSNTTMASAASSKTTTSTRPEVMTGTMFCIDTNRRNNVYTLCPIVHTSQTDMVEASGVPAALTPPSSSSDSAARGATNPLTSLRRRIAKLWRSSGLESLTRSTGNHKSHSRSSGSNSRGHQSAHQDPLVQDLRVRNRKLADALAKAVEVARTQQDLINDQHGVIEEQRRRLAAMTRLLTRLEEWMGTRKATRDRKPQKLQGTQRLRVARI
ncbi:hypothetical protein BX600DRAFT_506892 [Xylariales sp. PMI_506]|nr:hypothetical protein BX600DRAFT_506892 [Xylariales sp. PMI_506]